MRSPQVLDFLREITLLLKGSRGCTDNTFTYFKQKFCDDCFSSDKYLVFQKQSNYWESSLAKSSKRILHIISLNPAP